MGFLGGGGVMTLAGFFGSLGLGPRRSRAGGGGLAQGLRRA
jgi:hypothetical protein